MSENENKTPLEELQEQLNKMLGGQKIQIPPGFAGSSAAQTTQPPPAKKTKEEDPLKVVRDFRLKPREIFDHLNRFVIGQKEAKKVLSVAICDHYNRIRQCFENPSLEEAEYHKQNILLLGPTGVGKTYLMRHIAKLIGVPFIKGDATKFSETGYVGGDVEDLVRDLVRAADGDVRLAEYGIIYVDEIDKIASESSSSGKDVSGRGVQINLLKLMEETEVSPFGPNDMMAQMKAMMGGMGGRSQGDPSRPISTRHILFIVSGAFDKLAESIRRRRDGASIGFNADHSGDPASMSRYLHHAETADFIKYGFEPEFVGRLPVRVACDSLSPKDLSTILTTSEGSILNQYRSDFAGHGIDFTITPEAIETIARKAHEEGTGARGIMTVLERTFRDFKYELPSTAIRSFEVSEGIVETPRQALDELLQANIHLQKGVFEEDVRGFAQDYHRDTGFQLDFTADAVVAVAEKAEKQERTIRTVCADLFKDFVHGLKIISRNTGEKTFAIDRDCIEDPDKILSNWVVRSFRQEETNEAEPPPSPSGDDPSTRE